MFQKSECWRFNAILCFLSFFFYAINTGLRRQGVWTDCLFMKNHFNDCLAMVAELSLYNFFSELRGRKGIYNPALLFLVFLCSSLFWEYGVVYLRKNSIPDPLDVLCYFFGTVAYYLFYRIYLHKTSAME